MPALIEAAQARCTVGEIMNALADVFGRYEGRRGGETRNQGERR